jgi:NADH dehydrogenase
MPLNMLSSSKKLDAGHGVQEMDVKIVIIGGGAGGLELATHLGNKLGRRDHSQVVLIDRNPTHVWKPLLHEVAAGSLDADIDSVSYRAHASQHGFQFKLGEFCGLDRQRKTLSLAAMQDEQGEEILPPREVVYDKLVIAVGSMSNDFNVPGVSEHCQFLDRTDQAIRFHKQLVNAFIRLDQKLIDQPANALRIAIIGGGATGVELAAEMFNARHWFSVYGLERVTEANLQVTLLEAGPRLVPVLTPRVSAQVLSQLQKLGADIRLNTHVERIEKGRLIAGADCTVDADLIVWAAGIKISAFIADIDGLETNRINQILVRKTLQINGDDDIYAIGDCAGYSLGDNRWVPPRAQSAHQMASQAAKNILRSIRGKPLKAFKYRDHGSLVSLSQYTTIGVLMGNLGRGSNLNLEGWLARMAYISLYRMHQIALYGWAKATLLVVSDKINHIVRPRLKLH